MEATQEATLTAVEEEEEEGVGRMQRERPIVLTELQEFAIQQFLNNKDEYPYMFLTGSAGTGKSECIKEIARRTSERITITATTGIAARIIGGQTLHSFIGIMDNNFENVTEMLNKVKNKSSTVSRIKRTQILVIDEISVLPRDMFAMISQLLSAIRGDERHFGGIQCLFVGDFLQLPPVENPFREYIIEGEFKKEEYLFQSTLWKNMRLNERTIILKEIVRTNQNLYMMMLGEIRTSRISGPMMKEIHLLERKITRGQVKQLNPSADIPLREYGMEATIDDYVQHLNYIALCGTNREAKEINMRQLERLRGEPKVFESVDLIDEAFKAQSPHFDTKSVLKNTNIPKRLRVKRWSIVMLLVNQKNIILHDGTSPVNGSIGIVTDFYIRDEVVLPRVFFFNPGDPFENRPDKNFMTKHAVVIYPVLRGMLKPDIPPEEYDDPTKYYVCRYGIPMKLSNAITIHKSQGSTFKNIVVKGGSTFNVPGMIYVALSRSTSINNVVVFGSLTIVVSDRAVKYYDKMAIRQARILDHKMGQEYHGNRGREVIVRVSNEQETIMSESALFGKRLKQEMGRGQVPVMRTIIEVDEIVKNELLRLISISLNQLIQFAIEHTHMYITEIEEYAHALIREEGVQAARKNLIEKIFSVYYVQDYGQEQEEGTGMDIEGELEKGKEKIYGKRKREEI